MSPEVSALIEKMSALQAELDAAMAKRRAELRVGLEKGRVAFEAELLRRHAELKTALSTYIWNAPLLVILTAPFIYALIVPLVLLDIFVTVYQAICFPVYGIAKVKRAEYFVFDRHHLAYLNAIEKLNCAYCSYANCLLAYVREIAARTEQYWCPIKHARRMVGVHARYATFDDYGDAEGYQARLVRLREALARDEEKKDVAPAT
jgi:hypothetical protein